MSKCCNNKSLLKFILLYIFDGFFLEVFFIAAHIAYAFHKAKGVLSLYFMDASLVVVVISLCTIIQDCIRNEHEMNEYL